jgi:hypothetical protein
MTETALVWMDPKAFPGRLIIPRSDPNRYESPADLLFDSVEEAAAWRDEELDAYADDAYEAAYIRRWVLCRRTLEVLPTQPVAQEDVR